MVFVMDKLWCAQTASNRTLLGLRSGRPIMPLQVSLLLSTVALKSPSKTTESPGGAPQGRALWTVIRRNLCTTFRTHFLTQWHSEQTLSSTEKNSNMVIKVKVFSHSVPYSAHVYYLWVPFDSLVCLKTDPALLRPLLVGPAMHQQSPEKNVWPAELL